MPEFVERWKGEYEKSPSRQRFPGDGLVGTGWMLGGALEGLRRADQRNGAIDDITILIRRQVEPAKLKDDILRPDLRAVRTVTDSCSQFAPVPEYASAFSGEDDENAEVIGLVFGQADEERPFFPPLAWRRQFVRDVEAVLDGHASSLVVKHEMSNMILAFAHDAPPDSCLMCTAEDKGNGSETFVVRQPNKKTALTAALSWSGWRDLNPRPPRPERGALAICATARCLS